MHYFLKHTSPLLLAAICLLPMAVLAETDSEPQGESQLDTLRRHAGESAQFHLAVPLIIDGREIVVFRTNLFGIPPQERAAMAKLRIKAYAAEAGKSLVSVYREPQGYVVTVDGRGVFGVTEGDINPLDKIPPEEIATNAMHQLEKVIQLQKDQRSLRGIIISIISSLVITGLLVAVFWTINRGGKWLIIRLTFWTSKGANKFAATAASGHSYRRTFADFWERTIIALSWCLRLLAVWLWLTYVLEQFPLTRVVGDYFKDYLILASRKGVTELIKVIPDLLVVVVIFYVTRFLSQLVTLLFVSISEERTKVSWLDANAAPTTQRIVHILLWLLALVMAYPYLPGSGTQAFKAVTVFAGLLLSLGSSSVINQIASGLLLVYCRAVKPGEYVRVSDTEGTVLRIGLVATSIRSIKNETITVPNTVLIGSTTINFSRPASPPGVFLHTTVTIGYTTPWRLVHDMLKQAAQKTPGLLPDPEPFVLQTALSDFYVQYQINARLKNPADRVDVLAALHANIQDVFNVNGVQIMSPHYLSDPEKPAIVPPKQWHATPVMPPKPEK